MIRREFITGLAGAAAWPLAARGQQAERMRRIGVLWATIEDSAQTNARLLAFRRTLERLGWSEGHNLRIDTRFATAREESAQVFAKELIALQPELLLAYSTPMVVALQREPRHRRIRADTKRWSCFASGLNDEPAPRRPSRSRDCAPLADGLGVQSSRHSWRSLVL